VNAIHDVKDPSLLKQSTLYVNLEPCSHTGKTPPCADLIIRSGIPEVVVGIADPNPLVAGKGLQKLKEAGIKVTANVLAEPCAELNKRFITYHTRHRPYIIIKWAETLDGFIDVVRGDPEIQEPTWISNEISRMLVHKWRSEEQSIMVGTRTVIMDNPHLNVREWPGKSPMRLVIDRNLRLPHNMHVLDDQHPTVIFNEVKQEAGEFTQYIKIDFDHDFLPQVMHHLYEAGIQSLLVEGGRFLIESLISEDLWDEIRVFKGSKLFGKGLPAPIIPSVKPETYFIRKDVLMIYRNEPVLQLH
jgi:diaminohydroxyphosphoribosylaminopyrimidine deaminase/5-amino-6-(5-phosphoribosylamino)uracil reductase